MTIATLPRPVLWLGLTGIIPQAACLAAALALPDWRWVALAAGCFYAAVILIAVALAKRIPYHVFARLHKWLAVVHMGGMIATNVLAEKANDPKIKPIHRAAAFATFASYAAAIITIKF